MLVAVAALLLTGLVHAQVWGDAHKSRCDCVPGLPQPVFTAPVGEDTECPAVARNGDVYTAEMSLREDLPH